MKKTALLICCIIGAISLTACKKSGENQAGSAESVAAQKATFVLELDKDYDDSDPFVNACLFCVSEDMDILNAELTMKLDGESGIVEIKDNKTNEVLWSKTWNEPVEYETVAFSLDGVQKEKEYAIWFTGTKINDAAATVTFESNLVQERERPSK